MTLVLSRRAALAAAFGSAVSLAACGGSSSSGGGTASPAAGSASASSAAAYPVTLTHAFGSTTVERAPTRVVTWGWGSADAAIALGVVPVAIPKQTYGGDADGVLPWIRERLTANGATLPTILPDAQEARSRRSPQPGPT